MSKKVRFGLIGCGAIAKFHAVSIGQIEGAELVAAFDPYKPGLDKFVAEYGVTGYDTLEALLADPNVDAVSICTYNCQHAPCAIDALEHGVNVMLEKPFTVTLDEAIAVMKAEKASGKILTIGFQPRMSINMQRIKQIVESGELGQIYYIQ